MVSHARYPSSASATRPAESPAALRMTPSSSASVQRPGASFCGWESPKAMSDGRAVADARRADSVGLDLVLAMRLGS